MNKPERHTKNHTLALEVGQRITQLRKERGETQVKLAEQIGYENFKIISAYEKGRAVPPLRSLIRLADHFGVTLDYLGRGKNIPTKTKAQRK